MGGDAKVDLKRTILPEVEGNITEAVACTNGSSFTAYREVSEVVEGDSQVAVFTTKGERSVYEAEAVQYELAKYEKFRRTDMNVHRCGR